jgi:hypothetical protein
MTPRFEEQERQRKDIESSVRWVGLIVSAILAAAGGWGASQATRKESAPPAAGPPKMHTEELGLGADGKGGVWRREVPPWER